MSIGGTGQIEFGFGGNLGLGEIAVPRGDDVSFALDVSSVFKDGLLIFGRHFRSPTLYINTNGTISFAEPVSEYPAEGLEIATLILAGFWGDVDTRLDGERTESGQIWADIDTENAVVTVTWHNVGVYRRNADLTNTFQMQIFDQGNGDFDIAFRYEQIEWTIGSADDDTGVVAGIFDPSGQSMKIGGPDLTSLSEAVGNGGITGLWAYSVINGEIRDYFSQIPQVWGDASHDFLTGTNGPEQINALAGDDTLTGGAGSDTIDSGEGDDHVLAGSGNDQVFGRAGDDVLIGETGADQLFGEQGQDILTGSSRSDTIFGGEGDDFINGGWGHDWLAGGPGADRFYHEGIQDHGSDWITDFYHAEGDVLVFNGPAHSDDFLVQYAETSGAGANGTNEAFVTYVPTGQILWALVDGEDEDQVVVVANGDVIELI